ncbi:MAG: hypothetical protein AAF609_18520 [Cyanobacteria bacterium P01_C01_bin.120]
MESATPEGLKALSKIIQYCQDNEARIKSDRAFARAMIEDDPTGSEDTQGNPQSISRMKKAWALAGTQTFAQGSLYRLAPYLWIPGSEFRDKITGETLSKLYFDGEELRAVVEGHATVCSLGQMAAILNNDSLKGISPFTAAIEERRRDRRHTYADLCKSCELPAGDENRIRRLLAFNGWSPDPFKITLDLTALAQYLMNVKPGMSTEENRAERERAFSNLAVLHSKSAQHKLNGASA